nr:uncharacterized protein LOC129274729 [Lytechinus pictus]
MSKDEKKPFRVILWCVPRAVSTAISKCFSFIDNTESWLEPFCGLYTLETSCAPMGIPLPQNEGEIDDFLEKLEATVKDTPLEPFMKKEGINRSMLLLRKIQERLNSAPADKNVFVKDIAIAAQGRYDYFPVGYRHTFLIRHPERMFPSFRKMIIDWGLKSNLIPEAAAEDMIKYFDFTRDLPNATPGFPYDCQYNLWRHIKENYEEQPVVMDVDEMLANPGKMLPKFFEAAGMPWDEKYLRWDPSPEGALDWHWVFKMEMDKVSFGNIHKEAVTSSEFGPSKPLVPRDQMTPDIIKSVDGAIEYYNEMAATRITI